jgi:hypothetical protein
LGAHPILPYPQSFDWNEGWEAGIQDYGLVEPLITAMAQLHHDARQWYRRWFDRVNDLAQEMQNGGNDYLHLDIYLWITKNSTELSQQIENFPALARWQECLFLELLDDAHPKDVLCLYKSAAVHVGRLCRRNNLGFDIETECSKVEDVPLSVAAILSMGNRQPITLFRPEGGSVPTGRNCINNEKFERVLRFFHDRYH